MNGLAILTVLVTVGSTEANRIISGKESTGSPVIGGFILGIFLFAFMALNPSLGSKFCYLIIISALLLNGNGLFKALNPKRTNPALAKAAQARKGTVAV